MEAWFCECVAPPMVKMVQIADSCSAT